MFTKLFSQARQGESRCQDSGRPGKGAGISLCFSVTLWVALAAGLMGAATAADAGKYQELTWTELMPADDLKLLEEMSEISHEGNQAPSLPEQLLAGRVVPEMNGRAIRIPGFVVPLEVSEDQRITEFFLVPYYGACIHVPPPPPNQIIHVRYEEGFTAEALYDAFWITGTLRTAETVNELAESSYVMEADSVILYQD